MNGLQQPSAIFRHSAVALFCHWCVVAPVTVYAVSLVGELSIDGRPGWHWAAIIAAMTMIVALLSMLPGAMLPEVRSGGDRATSAWLFLVGCSAAMAIRAGATVAMVVVCRYKIGPGNEELGDLPLATLMIGLWYVAAAIDEVRLLSAGGRSLDANCVVEQGR